MEQGCGVVAVFLHDLPRPVRLAGQDRADQPRVLAVNIEHSNAQHEAIVAAILAGDARKARRVMTEHCEDTAALLRGLLG